MNRRNSHAQTMHAQRGGNRQAYPFAAIVGQREMKLALLLNAIDPGIGGVLAMGQRGTGKSTAVRALADLLPSILRVEACPYGCDPKDEKNLCADCAGELEKSGKLKGVRAAVPLVELPLGATEDRVCGTIDFERALTEGVKAYDAGLLARANRGFLYIDEVNLLEDHLVDLLLDVAVTGRNLVEREGVSIEHPARFVLVGSGNPEEGELRPQLVDRFGLHVEVKTVEDLDERVEIVERHQRFKLDAEAFRASFEAEQEELRRLLVRARKNLRAVRLSRALTRRIAELCQKLKIDGHRGELTIAVSARALAAFKGQREVRDEHVREVAAMALRHRLRRDPLEQTASSARIEQALAQLFPEDQKSRTQTGDGSGEGDEKTHTLAESGTPNGREAAKRGASMEGMRTGGATQDAPPVRSAPLPEASLDASVERENKSKARARQARHQANGIRNKENSERGRYTRATARRTYGSKVALDATLRAAVQASRGKRDVEAALGKAVDGSRASQPLTPIAPDALRYKCFRKKRGTLFIFAVDASGSMALNRINQAKGTLFRLLERSYVRRDRVALISFRERGASVHLQPSRSVARARRMLDALPVGGATPLSAGLAASVEVARSASRQDHGEIVLLVFTDGRANVSLSAQGGSDRSERLRLIGLELEQLGAALRRARVTTVVVDTQNRFTSNGEARALADKLVGRYVPLPFSGDSLRQDFP